LKKKQLSIISITLRKITRKLTTCALCIDNHIFNAICTVHYHLRINTTATHRTQTITANGLYLYSATVYVHWTVTRYTIYNTRSSITVLLPLCMV